MMMMIDTKKYSIIMKMSHVYTAHVNFEISFYKGKEEVLKVVEESSIQFRVYFYLFTSLLYFMISKVVC